MRRVTAAFLLSLSLLPAHASSNANVRTIQVETLLKTGTAWDGSSYAAYPGGKPEVAVLKITIPAHTTMDWHQHPMPNVAYVVSGELTVEKQDGSLTRHFTAGQTVPEIVNVGHRGVTGDQAVELLVFYAGASGLPLSVRPAN